MLGIIRYRNVVDPSTGPIIRLTSWKNDHNILGEYYDSVAYLHPTLCIPKSTEIYANGAGGGASKFKIVAIQKAISEALERWAFFQLSVDSQAEQRRLGLDVDPTSTGERKLKKRLLNDGLCLIGGEINFQLKFF
jgi:hypothetical protein